MFKPIIIDDFATDQEINEIYNIYTNSKISLEAQRCLECNKPYMKYYDLENNIFNHWASKINEITNRNMRLSYKALSVMVNTHMPYHADNTAPEEGSYILGIPSHNIRFGLNIVDHISWKPNHCPNRVLTAIVYINTILKDNNDYGATALPQHNLLIHPVSKRLSIFSCDHYSIHGVMNVGKNIRIAALLWFEENT